MKKKAKTTKKESSNQQHDNHRNRPLHIPLDFDKAVDGLLKIKPKKNQNKPS